MRCVCLVLFWIVLAPTAAAQDDAAGRTASLGWVRLPGAESCPSAQAIAQATEALLGREAFVPPADAALAIEGRAEAREGGFRATLAVSDATGASVGERVVEADGTCDALLSPLSIVLAILVDPDATPVTPPPDDPPDPIIETRVITERVEVPVEVRSPPWRLELDLGAVLAVGATPFVSGGGELYVFLTPPGFVPIGLHGWIVPFSRADFGAGLFVDQLTSWVGLSICPAAAHDETFSIAACAGLDVGAVFVVGSERTVVPTDTNRITGGLDLSVRGRVHLIGPLWLTLSAALLVPFRNQSFNYAMTIPYYAPEPVALIVTLGPSFAFDL
jgi:hypothetical protein